MDNTELIQWLEELEKKYEVTSESIEDFNYQKGLMDGAKIAISSVIIRIKKEDN